MMSRGGPQAIREGNPVSANQTPHTPMEISVQARFCNGNRYYAVGDLLTYRSGLWLVKGLFFGATQSGERELYYILSEATGSSGQFGAF
jgi:hypothetical protein